MLSRNDIISRNIDPQNSRNIDPVELDIEMKNLEFESENLESEIANIDIKNNISKMLDSLFDIENLSDSTYNEIMTENLEIKENINSRNIQIKYIFIPFDTSKKINKILKFLYQYTSITDYINNIRKLRILNIESFDIKNKETFNFLNHLIQTCFEYNFDTFYSLSSDVFTSDLIVDPKMIYYTIEKIILNLYNYILNNHKPIFLETIDNYKKSYIINIISEKYNIPYSVIDLFIICTYNLEYRKIINKNVINMLNFEIDSDMKTIKNILNFKRFNSVRLLYGMCTQYNFLLSQSIQGKKIFLKKLDDIINLLQSPLFEALFK